MSGIDFPPSQFKIRSLLKCTCLLIIFIIQLDIQIWSRNPISQNFNSCVTDGRTDTPSFRDARTHLRMSPLVIIGHLEKKVMILTDNKSLTVVEEA